MSAAAGHPHANLVVVIKVSQDIVLLIVAAQISAAVVSTRVMREYGITRRTPESTGEQRRVRGRDGRGKQAQRPEISPISVNLVGEGEG